MDLDNLQAYTGTTEVRPDGARQRSHRPRFDKPKALYRRYCAGFSAGFFGSAAGVAGFATFQKLGSAFAISGLT